MLKRSRSLSVIYVCATMFCLVSIAVPIHSLSAGDSDRTVENPFYMDDSFSIDAGIERWEGYTEYEIRAGTTVYGPTGEDVLVRSRLRFPVKSALLRIGGSYQTGRLRFASHANLQLQNSETVFKDWDTYEKGRDQRTFIYGTATNSGKLIGFDVACSYRLYCGRFEFRPQIEFAFRRMEFDDETLTQVDYAYFDTLTAYLEPYESPQYYYVPGSVLRYKIDYKILYFGGSTLFRSPSGFNSELTAMIAPVCWASDFDEHLLRSKTAEISSSGWAGYMKLDAGYRLNQFITLSAQVAYDVIRTSGPQDQTILRPSYLTIENIAAKTKAEWMTIGFSIDFNLTRMRDM